LLEARGDDVLAAVVCQIEDDGIRYPDCVFEALVEAERSSLLSPWG
jgi:hypothetical protein